MKQDQWNTVLACAAMQEMNELPVALIVDSPWIPGHTGMNTLDFFTDMGLWWGAQQRIRAEFPSVLFIPDYWVEFGMASEPSGFGCKVNFYEDRPPTIRHLIEDCDEIESLDDLPVPNPRRDGLMPLAVNYYRRIGKIARDAGDPVRMVSARGPLNIATHMIGVTNFLLAMKIYPESTHKLLRKTATLARHWLEAQAEAVGGVEGVLLLDDIIGFLSPEDYEEFVHPYFKEIYDAFSVPVKMLHNDTDNPVSYPRIRDFGVNIFNFTHEKPLSEVRALCGDGMCLMGNIPPLSVLAKGTPEEVARETAGRLDDYKSRRGLIVSAGGGASPGMPGANLLAMAAAARDWSRRAK